MGLDINTRDVLITAEAQPGQPGVMKIRFQLRLNSEECDAEMAEEVKEEVEESLTEKGGTVFANCLARTAKELKCVLPLCVCGGGGRASECVCGGGGACVCGFCGAVAFVCVVAAAAAAAVHWGDKSKEEEEEQWCSGAVVQC
jgi:hypothetical protein